MKKEMLTIPIIALGILVATPAMADWGLFATHWSTDDAGDATGAGIKIATEMIEGVNLDFRVSFYGDLGEDRGSVDTDLEAIPLELGLSVTWPTSDRVDLFGGGGIGYYLFDGDVSVPGGVGIEADPDNEVGFYLAGGVEYALRDNQAFYGKTEAALFAEVFYRSVEADNITLDSATDVSLGDANLDGIGVNVGLMIKW